MLGTPSGVVFSPQQPSLVGGTSLELPVQQCEVIANFDPVLPAPAALPPLSGTVDKDESSERSGCGRHRLGGRLDELQHLIWVGDHGHVVGRDVHRGGARA
jgi:hypothetical protein